MLKSEKNEFEIVKLKDYEISKISKRLLYLIQEENEPDIGEDDLEELLEKLGQVDISNGKVNWTPIEKLDPMIVNTFQHSVSILNHYIESGIVKITKDGQII